MIDFKVCCILMYLKISKFISDNFKTFFNILSIVLSVTALIFMLYKSKTFDLQNDSLFDIFSSLAKNETSKIYRGGFSRYFDQTYPNKSHIIVHQVFIYQLD
jgi:hypothetical protein